MAKLKYMLADSTMSRAQIDAVTTTLKGGRLTRGALTEEFEQEIARYVGYRYAVAFSSGGAALFSAFKLFRPGVFVIPWNSFISTFSSCVLAGHKVHLAMINPKDGMIDNSLLELSMKEVPKTEEGIHSCGVDLYGNVSHGSYDICDGCQSYGHIDFNLNSSIKVTSFHPSKTVTCGEGGAVFTNSQSVADSLKNIRNSGRGFGDVNTSFNLHMTEMQASVGLVSLRSIEHDRDIRKYLYNIYQEELFPHTRIILLPQYKDSMYVNIVIRLKAKTQGTEERNTLAKKLSLRGIETSVNFPPPLLVSDKIINARPYKELYFSQQILTLPLHKGLSGDDVKTICEAIKSCYRGSSKGRL